MKIVITGKPKEIAALAVETQRRQMKMNMELRVSKDMEDFKAMKKGIALLQALQSGLRGEYGSAARVVTADGTVDRYGENRKVTRADGTPL